MCLNPAKRNSAQIQKLFVPFFILVILILPVVDIVSASLVAAALIGDVDHQTLDANSRQTAGNIKSEKSLAQGKFLVADGRLMDPNFRETVVLLIRYGPDGAMGLVINRPVQLKLSTILPDIKELERSNETLFLGGPVEPARVMLLVKTASPPEASLPVFGDVYLSSSQKVLQRLIKKPAKEERFQIYAGYAGWAPKQLESECDRGHWHILKADTETLFDKKRSEIWQELIHRVSVKWVRSINSQKLPGKSYRRNPVRRKIIK